MIDEKRFMSRKNIVILGEDNIIRKKFATKSAMGNELFYHTELQKAGLTVPRLLKQDEDELYYEYIDGMHYLNCLNAWEELFNQSKKPSLHIWVKLAEWLCCFYEKCPGMITGDPNLRNFILDDVGNCYGIDFEDYMRGDKYEDIAVLLSYIATYNPAMTEGKQIICHSLLDVFTDRLDITRDKLSMIWSRKLFELEERRNKR